MTDQKEYTASDIQVLEGLEGVRKRPAMYIGDIGKRGVHHLIYEIVDNSVDEALAGHCKNISVTLHSDGRVTVTDDGRGIPTEAHKSGKSALELVSSSLHAGGKFEKSAYKVSGGLHGVGLSVVNALSEWMTIEVHRNGVIHTIAYAQGKLTHPITHKGTTQSRGTTVVFKPDSTIFTTTTYEYDYLRERIMELAFLNKGLTITLSDERDGRTEKFVFEGGIKEFVDYLNKSKTRLHESFFFSKTTDNVEVDCAFQYTDSYSEIIYSFVNDIRTTEGGTHLVGFRTALTRVVNDQLRSNKQLKDDQKISGDDAIEGITLVLSVKVPEPQFEGQTKTKLGNGEVRGIVDSVSYELLKSFFEEHPQAAKAIGTKVINSMQAREAAQKAKDLIRRKNVFENSILPGKLADCEESKASLCELFLVEGDSAGGSAKSARDRKFQAILPLKGKILNVEKAPIHRALASDEIKNIALTIGAGFGDDFSIEKVRYHKIVIMTDADVDGAHIRTLLLTLFYRYFKEIILKGYVYIAQPPLYRVKKGKQETYVYSDAVLKTIDTSHSEIQRYKGLGEMNPDQLWTTTMNPEARTLKRVTIEDAIRADELFTILMGEEVEPRRQFIEQNYADVKNLDV